MLKVKQLAKLAGVSVRTLHYYDQIGLLSPAKINEKGYRLYSEDDLLRLQQILFFRELQFPLREIKEILEDEGFDHKKALVQHKHVLLEKKERLERIIHSVDQTLDSMSGGTYMSNRDRFEPFDRSKLEEHQKKYAKEVQERWGQTDAYKESQRKTSSYTEDDWKKIHQENEEIEQGIIERMDRGAGDPAIQKLIGDKRQHISDYFYQCTPEIFRGLGDMYVNDPRFQKNINKKQEGLAEFYQEAIRIYCDQLSND